MFLFDKLPFGSKSNGRLLFKLRRHRNSFLCRDDVECDCWMEPIIFFALEDIRYCHLYTCICINMCVCIQICCISDTAIYIHIPMYVAYINMYIYICVAYEPFRMYIAQKIHTKIHTYMFFLYLRVSEFIYIYIYIYIYMHVFSVLRMYFIS